LAISARVVLANRLAIWRRLVRRVARLASALDSSSSLTRATSALRRFSNSFSWARVGPVGFPSGQPGRAARQGTYLAHPDRRIR